MDPRQACYLILQEIRRRTDATALWKLYPDDGPLRRELYVKHLKMFAAGTKHQERCALGGNRVGKSLGIGGYEMALHITGLYPEWWPGRVYTKPILTWACGTKATKVRDVNQHILLGKLNMKKGFTQASGGLVPGPRISRLTRKTGTSDAVDQAIITHVKGWENIVTFKSYEEGRQGFESEAVDFIWLDEEPNKSIYDECMMRLLTTKGSLLLTNTPLDGMTECILSILEDTDFI